MRALLSVTDKSGLAEFAAGLARNGIELIASGGTARHLLEAGLAVQSVEDLTGLPSVLGGRVKTLHPAIHGGILAQRSEQDLATLESRGWAPIDIVVVNLYRFAETVAGGQVADSEAIEQVDIGGVALIRAAAKNFAHVAVITEPLDYDLVLHEIEQHGTTSDELRRALAVKAFGLTSSYDKAIFNFLGQEDAATLPLTLEISLPQAALLRYGENPHQQAALYAAPGVGPLGGKLLHGKALSYNNLLDVDAAWAAAKDFDAPTIVIVKHLSPCGIASGADLAATFKAALNSDPLSAFGGVIACNVEFDGGAAGAIGDLFVEVIIAPRYSPEALQILKRRKNLRILRVAVTASDSLSIRSIYAGMLVQSADHDSPEEWRVVSQRQPTAEEITALRFAWQASKHVKSNAIVLARGDATVGIGGGLPSRVDAAQLAARKAGADAIGSVMASDAFFPFPDGIEAAAAAGVVAVVQPGGSLRDESVIEAADRLGLAMCFTGVRHFRH